MLLIYDYALDNQRSRTKKSNGYVTLRGVLYINRNVFAHAQSVNNIEIKIIKKYACMLVDNLILNTTQSYSWTQHQGAHQHC